jgi:hypothetical protein
MNLTTILKLIVTIAPLIPTLISDFEAVKEAVAAKGVDLETEIKNIATAAEKLLADIASV